MPFATGAIQKVNGASLAKFRNSWHPRIQRAPFSACKRAAVPVLHLGCRTAAQHCDTRQGNRPAQMLAASSPSHCAERMRSDCPDEVSTWAARRDCDHSRVVHDAGPYGFEAAVLNGERVQLGWARNGLRQTLRARALRPFIQVPIDGPQQYRFGRQCIDVAPGAMAFIAPGTETSRHSGPGWVFALDVDDAALATEVHGRCPGAVHDWPQMPQVLEPAEPVRRSLSEAVAELVRAFDADAHSTQRTHCESRVVAALVDALMMKSMANIAGRLAGQRRDTSRRD